MMKLLRNLKRKSEVKAKRLVVKSKTENLALIREFISNSAEEVNVAPDVLENIILAVDEACTNIIKHAYGSKPDGEIDLKVKFEANKFIVTIIDYGKSFKPESIPEPDLQKYYRQRRVGGLGVYLMKTLMDEVKYETIPGKYNQVLLSKKINLAQSNVR